MNEPPLHFHNPRTSKFGIPCGNCFSYAALTEAANVREYRGIENKYINILDFPKFYGFKGLSKLESYDTRELSFPWFADFIYTIRTPIPHKYHPIHSFVLQSKRVQETCEKVAFEQNLSVKSVKKYVSYCLSQMKSSLNRFICRICGYVLFKVFRRVMKRLLVNPAQLVKIKEAEETGIPIVYLPLHRSHLDYLLITWTIWHFNLRLPHIASGDNLNLSGFGWLLRATGAFFIHRSVDPKDDSNKNIVYRAVLNSYMTEIIKSGMSIEFFLEGTRSRFGKTLLPKNGLISNIVDAVENGIIPDVYLVPVSYSYDNIVEGIFHEELMGIRKEKESVYSIIRGIFKGFGKKGKCGTVTIDFGAPCRLTDYLSSLRSSLSENRDSFTINLEYSANPHSYRELLPWHDNSTPNRTLIRAVGYHVVFEAHQQKPITISSIISMLLLCLHRKKVRLLQFIRDMSFLCNDITNLGYEVVGWDEQVEPDLAFEDAITNFRPSIIISRDSEESGPEGLWIELPKSHHSIMDLCYRKNGSIAPFALLSVISMVIMTTKIDLNNDENIPIDDMVHQTLTLCNILQTEIIFCRPCENLKEKITQIFNEILRSLTNGFCQFKGQIMNFDLNFYSNVLRPFLQTTFIVLKYFFQHQKLNPKDKLEIDFIRRFLLEKSQNRDPSLFSESYNSDSVHNSIKLLRLKKIVADDRLELIDANHAEYLIRLLEKYVREPKIIQIMH